MVPSDINSSENFHPGYYNHLCWRRRMHWDDSGASSRVSPARVEEDDEHRHDDEEAQGPQQVVQEDVHLCRAAVIRSLPEKAKYQVKWGFQFRWIMLLGWIVIHRDPRSPVIKFCGGVQPEITNQVVSNLRSSFSLSDNLGSDTCFLFLKTCLYFPFSCFLFFKTFCTFLGNSPCGAFCWRHGVVGIRLNLAKEVDEGIDDLVSIRNKNWRKKQPLMKTG